MSRSSRQRWWLALVLFLLVALCAWIAVGAGLFPLSWAQGNAVAAPMVDRAAAARQRVEPALRDALDEARLRWGAPILLRIFKQDDELEMWVEDDDGRYRLFRAWPICSWSGRLGPKLAEGDGQAPEGFYSVGASAMNPRSQFHLSFNLGFPNAFDRGHGRTGSFLMVHGNCVSIGCYAMGDDAIEEIYTLLTAAHEAGQRDVPVHAFPFRFDDGWRERHAGSPWLDFWDQLAAADAVFRRTARLPAIRVIQDRYVVID